MKAKPEVVPSSMVTTGGKVLETFMITGLSFSARFSLSDHEDIRSDLGNCMIYGPSCLLGGSASGAQLMPATLSPLCPGSILWYSSLWCRVTLPNVALAEPLTPNPNFSIASPHFIVFISLIGV